MVNVFLWKSAIWVGVGSWIFIQSFTSSKERLLIKKIFRLQNGIKWVMCVEVASFLDIPSIPCAQPSRERNCSDEPVQNRCCKQEATLVWTDNDEVSWLWRQEVSFKVRSKSSKNQIIRFRQSRAETAVLMGLTGCIRPFSVKVVSGDGSYACDCPKWYCTAKREPGQKHQYEIRR